MSSKIKLSSLSPGLEAEICSLPPDELCASRLTELGFYPGARIFRLYNAVFGDPCAFFVQGAVIALRRSESDRILVKPI